MAYYTEPNNLYVVADSYAVEVEMTADEIIALYTAYHDAQAWEIDV